MRYLCKYLWPYICFYVCMYASQKIHEHEYSYLLLHTVLKFVYLRVLVITAVHENIYASILEGVKVSNYKFIVVVGISISFAI